MRTLKRTLLFSREQARLVIGWAGVALVGTFGTALPVVAEGAGSGGSAPVDFSALREAVSGVWTELGVTYDEDRARIGNVALVRGSGWTPQFAIVGPDEAVVSTGSVFAYDLNDDTGLETQIKTVRGETTCWWSLTASLEDGAVVVAGTVQVLRGDDASTFAGAGRFQNGQFILSPESDEAFSEQMETMGLGLGFGLALFVLAVAALGLGCAVMGLDCGPLDDIWTGIGNFLQRILL